MKKKKRMGIGERRVREGMEMCVLGRGASCEVLRVGGWKVNLWSRWVQRREVRGVNGDAL